MNISIDCRYIISVSSLRLIFFQLLIDQRQISIHGGDSLGCFGQPGIPGLVNIQKAMENHHV